MVKTLGVESAQCKSSLHAGHRQNLYRVAFTVQSRENFKADQAFLCTGLNEAWQPVAIQGLRGLTVRTVTPPSSPWHFIKSSRVQQKSGKTVRVKFIQMNVWSAISCFTSNIPGRADKGCSPLPFNAPNLIIVIANPKNKFKMCQFCFTTGNTPNCLLFQFSC